MDSVPAQGVQVVLVRRNRFQPVLGHHLQETACKIHLTQTLAIEQKHAGINIVLVVNAHISVNIAHKRSDFLNGIVGNGTHQFCAQMLLVKL